MKIVGMNSKEFGSFGKAAAGLFESAQNQLFFQTANGFVITSSGFAAESLTVQSKLAALNGVAISRSLSERIVRLSKWFVSWAESPPPLRKCAEVTLCVFFPATYTVRRGVRRTVLEAYPSITIISGTHTINPLG